VDERGTQKRTRPRQSFGIRLVFKKYFIKYTTKKAFIYKSVSKNK
jgi:hypothetical protein